MFNITAATQLWYGVLVSQATNISGALHLFSYQLIGSSVLGLPSSVFCLFPPLRHEGHKVSLRVGLILGAAQRMKAAEQRKYL
jgi:hypothetical protein